MTAAIILAAGGSSRLGFPKQTLLFKGNTLLEIAIDAALKAKCDPVVVVLGANKEVIEPGIKDKEIIILHNENWAEGMGTSIKAAIGHLENIGEVKQVIIMLCDQPFVSRALLGSLIYKRQQNDSKIIACIYQDAIGVPALFDRFLFPELLSLKDNEGAKKVIKAHPEQVATVPFEKGGVDIDTVADYENLLNHI
jgi:molybdenum cofactor cytidylyltransferase